MTGVDVAHVELFIPCYLWTLNAQNRMHWASKSKKIRNAREAGKIVGLSNRRDLPKFTRCAIEGIPVVTQKSGVLADAGAYQPTLKAVIDGLVDAHIFANDTADIVTTQNCLGPVRGVRAGLRLTLIGEVQR